MKHCPPEQKLSIQLEYQPYSSTYSFAKLAQRNNIKEGARTIQNWYKQWNGTIDSLKEKPHTGRPSALNTNEVHHYISTPIINANRSATSLHYTDLIHLSDGKGVSLRPIQRIGEQQEHITVKSTKTRTARECK